MIARVVLLGSDPKNKDTSPERATWKIRHVDMVRTSATTLSLSRRLCATRGRVGESRNQSRGSPIKSPEQHTRKEAEAAQTPTAQPAVHPMLTATRGRSPVVLAVTWLVCERQFFGRPTTRPLIQARSTHMSSGSDSESSSFGCSSSKKTSPSTSPLNQFRASFLS